MSARFLESDADAPGNRDPRDAAAEDAPRRPAFVDRLAARALGIVAMGFAAALWWRLIPWQVEMAEYGWMRPQTLPQICAVGIGAAGLLLLIFPAGKVSPRPGLSLAAVGLAGLAGLGLWAMDAYGFLYAAPPLALAAALAMGERRPANLAAAAILPPAVIWLLAVELLGRSLP